MLRYFLIFSLLSISLLNASITLTNDVKKYEHFQLQYFYDDSSYLDIESIEKTSFVDTIPSQFTKGYHLGIGWFKLEINNQSNTEYFVVYFTEPFWSKLDLYTKSNNTWKVQRNGLNVMLKDRSIQDSNPAYRINIPTGESHTYYIKGQTISGHIGEFQVFNHEEYFKPSRSSITELYLIYMFVLFGIFLLNFYNYLRTREVIYAYYTAYIASFIIFISIKSGTYLMLDLQGWEEGLHTVGAFVVLFFILFSKRFLELKKYMPDCDIAFKISAGILVLFILLISQNVPYSSLLFNIFSSLLFVFLFIVTFKIWLKGSIGAKYYLIVLMIFIPTMSLMILTFNTLIDNNDITRYSFLAGAMFEIMVFTLLLTNRYMELNATNKLLSERTKELEETKKLLLVEATTDMLSGLYNRRYFSDISHKYFNTAKRYNQDLSILMIDIDDFKNVNDKYGHGVGDMVIEQSSNIFKTVARKSDIVARYGGEEFIILLPETTMDKACKLAERIREEIESKNLELLDSSICNITVSIGVTKLNDILDDNIEQTINRCDKALYKAKNGGKNQVYKLV